MTRQQLSGKFHKHRLNDNAFGVFGNFGFVQFPVPLPFPNHRVLARQCDVVSASKRVSCIKQNHAESAEF